VDDPASGRRRHHDPGAELTPEVIVEVLKEVAAHYFPRLAPARTADSAKT
jgi:hypothetical protein